MSFKEILTFLEAVIFAGIILYLLSYVHNLMTQKVKTSSRPIKRDREIARTPDQTALNAAESGNREELEDLLFKNEQLLYAKDKEQLTLLHKAVISGKKAIVELLLARSIFVDAEDALQRTPLHWAAGSGYFEIVELLIDRGASANARNEDGETPLHKSAEIGNIEISRLLVTRGADPDIETAIGSLLPWETALAAGHGELAKFLYARSSRKKDFSG